jgi:Domain of unknown function (DUF4169)
MAELINLRLARKARQRAEKDRQAAANRVKFGRTKSARDTERAEAERAARQLDGAKREEP